MRLVVHLWIIRPSKLKNRREEMARVLMPMVMDNKVKPGQTTRQEVHNALIARGIDVQPALPIRDAEGQVVKTWVNLPEESAPIAGPIIDENDGVAFQTFVIPECFSIYDLENISVDITSDTDEGHPQTYEIGRVVYINSATESFFQNTLGSYVAEGYSGVPTGFVDGSVNQSMSPCLVATFRTIPWKTPIGTPWELNSDDVMTLNSITLTYDGAQTKTWTGQGGATVKITNDFLNNRTNDVGQLYMLLMGDGKMYPVAWDDADHYWFSSDETDLDKEAAIEAYPAGI
jgi:hypothetical protein